MPFNKSVKKSSEGDHTRAHFSANLVLRTEVWGNRWVNSLHQVTFLTFMSVYEADTGEHILLICCCFYFFLTEYLNPLEV